ncbi:hypothetical protein AB205_0206410, partial [Aquarana catesbeiana]
MRGTLSDGFVYTRSEFPTTDFVVGKFYILLSNFVCRKIRWKMSDGAHTWSEFPTTRTDRTFSIGKSDHRESRKLRIRKEDPLNIFIVIDTSKSVGIRDFRTAKDISESFIEKISSYDIVPRFAVISYASTVKTIASLNDNLNPEEVIENLKTFRYS